VAAIHLDGAGIDAKSFDNHLAGKSSYRQAHNILLPFGQQPQPFFESFDTPLLRATMAPALPPPWREARITGKVAAGSNQARK